MSYYTELMADGVPKSIPADGFTFEDCFDEFVANHQKTWKYNRNEMVGASECFGCIRKTWFGKHGDKFGFTVDKDHEENWGAMRRGDIMENHLIVPAIRQGLHRRGMDLIMEGDDQETIRDGYNSATLDGLVVATDPALGGKLPKDFLEYYGFEGDLDADSVVLEMKSFDPRIEIKQAKAIHYGQTQMQMGLVRDTTEYKPEYAIVIYVNASWYDDIRAYLVPFVESEYLIGRERNEKVFEVEDPALFAPEGKLDGDCKYCKFKDACSLVSTGRVPDKRDALKAGEIDGQDPEMLSRMDALVETQARLKAIEKQNKRDVEEANEAIRQELINAGTSRAVGEGWKVFYSSQAGAKRLSTALMVEAGLDPDDYKEQGNGFEKLTVTTSK